MSKFPDKVSESWKKESIESLRILLARAKLEDNTKLLGMLHIKLLDTQLDIACSLLQNTLDWYDITDIPIFYESIEKFLELVKEEM